MPIRLELQHGSFVENVMFGTKQLNDHGHSEREEWKATVPGIVVITEHNKTLTLHPNGSTSSTGAIRESPPLPGSQASVALLMALTPHCAM